MQHSSDLSSLKAASITRKRWNKFHVTYGEGFRTLISPDKSWALTYGFNGIEQLPYNTGCCTDTTIAVVVPEYLARVGIDSSVDLHSILVEFAMAVVALKEVWTGCNIVVFQPWDTLF